MVLISTTLLTATIYRRCTDKEVIMTKARDCLIAASIAAITYAAACSASPAQGPLPGQPEFRKLLVEAAQASPGCLGVKLGQTEDGTGVIFAWFENKQALVAWYKSDFHQWAMKTAFPNQEFNREPLPDVPENSGQILALVTLKQGDTPLQGSTIPIVTIGIELYTPLPDGVAVGGRFAPRSVRHPGMREIDLRTAVGQPR
jgi:Antibiotic biosynthesis monooxygenase